MSNIPSSLLEQDKMIVEKSLRLRNDSDELDVFEAARYFSGANELVLGANLSQKSMKEQHVVTTRLQNSGGRMSLDMPSMRNSITSHAISEKTEMPVSKEKIKYKQPSSPGGKLASFLNSLFNQSNSKKKKTKSTTQSMKDEDESPGGGRRKRRSSISHFRSGGSNNIISSTSDSKSIYSTTSSATSGFRTPPPYGYSTTTKGTYKDQMPPPLTGLTSSLTSGLTKPIVGLDEKFKFRDGFLEKNKNLGNGFLEKGRILAEKCQNKEREITFKRFDKEDEGGDSDSSSDLFELTNCDLGYYSSGLPVYETTHMDGIKRGVPIPSGGPILI